MKYAYANLTISREIIKEMGIMEFVSTIKVPRESKLSIKGP
jgi:hypothetical protein